MTPAVQDSNTKPLVGMVARHWVDDARKNWQGTGPRPLNAFVWYPAAAGSKLSSAALGPPTEMSKLFTPVVLASDAPLSTEKKKYPLVVLSHGSTGVSLELMWFAHNLASHGYIVAAVEHHGNTGAEPQLMPQGFYFMWERARDLSVLIDKVEADSTFGPHIDHDRIAAAGHSAGGETVIALAGGKFNTQALRDFCASGKKDPVCGPEEQIRQTQETIEKLRATDAVARESLSHEHDSFRDKRIKAVFAMAPAVGVAFTADDVKDIHIPVYIVVGQGDDVTPPSTNAAHYAEIINGAKLTVLPGNVGHFDFGSLCSPEGIAKPDMLICHSGEGVDRAAVHQQTNDMALPFFAKALNIK